MICTGYISFILLPCVYCRAGDEGFRKETGNIVQAWMHINSAGEVAAVEGMDISGLLP